MIKYSLLMCLVLIMPEAARPCEQVPKNKQFEQLKRIHEILQKHSNKKAVPPAKLAPAIQRLSLKYGVDPLNVAAIILAESRGVASAHNKRTNDAGLMQISHKTATAYKFDTTKLFNWYSNLEYGIIVLSDMRGYPLCTYNIGYRKLPKACARYEAKIAFFKGGTK